MKEKYKSRRDCKRVEQRIDCNDEYTDQDTSRNLCKIVMKRNWK